MPLTKRRPSVRDSTSRSALRWLMRKQIRDHRTAEGEETIMCCGCWEDEGSPRIDNERVRGVQPLIEAVYKHNGVGGNLHIVLDDNNIDDGDLAFCLGQIDRGGHPEDPNHSPWYTQSKLDNPDSPEQL